MSGEPFGKPFKYTDSADLRTHLDEENPRPPWYKRWRKQRRPLAWAVVDGHLPVAFICPPQEPKQQLVDSKAITPIYDEAVVLAAAEAEEERCSSDSPTVPAE